MTDKGHHNHAVVPNCTVTLTKGAKMYVQDTVQNMGKKPTLQVNVTNGEIVIKSFSDKFYARSLDDTSLVYIPRKYEIEMKKA